jgi:hypothetical protein
MEPMSFDMIRNDGASITGQIKPGIPVIFQADSPYTFKQETKLVVPVPPDIITMRIDPMTLSSSLPLYIDDAKVRVTLNDHPASLVMAKKGVIVPRGKSKISVDPYPVVYGFQEGTVLYSEQIVIGLAVSLGVTILSSVFL